MISPIVTYKLVGILNSEIYFTIHKHSYNYTNEIEAGHGLTRDIILIYNGQFAHMIEFLPSEGTEFTIHMASPNTYNFYTAPEGYEIQDLTIMEENIRRVKYANSTCNSVDGLPAQNFYLVATIARPDTPPFVNIIHLPEFGNYRVGSIRTSLNPGNRPVDFSCINKYWNGVSCRVARSYYIQLSESVHLTKVSYFSELKASLNSTSRCEILKQYDMERYLACRQFESGFQCDLDFMKNLSGEALAQVFEKSMYSLLFIGTVETDKVLTYGIQPLMCTEDELLIQKMNEIAFIGDITDMHVTANSQHLIVPVARDKWEIDSLARFNAICLKLKNDTNNLFLQAFKDPCAKNPQMPIDLNQFGQWASICPPGVHCPSLSQNFLTQVKDRHYTFRPNTEYLCTPEHYCTQGVQLDCPQGFMCPVEGMTRPMKCEKDSTLSTTCGQSKTKNPLPCPEGTICTLPYAPGFPASPGFLVKTDSTMMRRVIAPCNPGEYCPLGRSISKERSELSCPEKTVCLNPDIMQPEICKCNATMCSYCPPGTFIESLCPAGFKCNPLRTPQILNCSRTDFCPNGTVVPQVCPPKYYCPTPDQKLLCPWGHYCKTGYTEALACPIPFFCPEGTETDPITFLGVLIDIVIVIIIVIIYVIASVSIHYYRKYRQKRRNLLEKGLLRSESMVKDRLSTGKPSNTCYMDIKFENLGLRLKTNGVTVLNNVNGMLRSGRVCAVMGPSGCGKSTFLTTISGRAFYGDQLGTIYINGVKDSLTKYKNLVGFVPQEDVMLRTMTVEDILFFSAYSRLDWRTPRELVTRIVDKVIKKLGLEEIRYQVIGDELTRGISGGQRKRVNIGMELVAKPVVLFLDEPTSGLDSSSSKEVCGALSDIARTGITIATVIHQPRYEIFTMFDDVLLLGKGGKVVYHGESARALEYFEKIGFKCPNLVNPPDFFMDIISGDVQRDGDPDFVKEDLFELWVQSQQPIEESDFPKTRTPKEESKSRKTLFITHLWLCFFRSFKQQFTNLRGFFVDNMLFFISALFTGMTFFQSSYIGPLPQEVIDACPIGLRPLCGSPQRDSIIMIAGASTLALGLSSSIAALKVFGSEVAVFRRENESGMSTIAYFVAKNLSQIISMLTAPLVYLSIFYSLFVPRGSFFAYYGLLLEVVFIGYGMGYLISITCGNYAQLSAIIISMIFFNFNGTTPTLNQLKDMPFPLFCMPYISYLRWMQEAVYLIEIGRYSSIYNIQTGLDYLDFSFDNLLRNILIGVGYGILVRFFAYLALVFSLPNSWFNIILNYVFALPKLIQTKCCRKTKKQDLKESLLDNDSLKRIPSIRPEGMVQIQEVAVEQSERQEYDFRMHGIAEVELKEVEN